MRVCLLASGIALAGCGGPAAPTTKPEQYVDAGHIRFFFPEGAPVCAQTPQFLDDMLGKLAEYLVVPLPEQVEYHYHPNPDLSDVCGTALSYSGCTYPQSPKTWSRDATSIHELVHVLTLQDGDHYSFLAEGLATALGEQNTWPASYDADQSEYLTPGPASPAKYGGIAGDMVSFLLVDRGVGPFMDLYGRVPVDATAEEFKAQFQAVYELDFDELLAQRRATEQRFAENRLRFPECSSPLQSWDDADHWASVSTVDCATNAIGRSSRLSGSPGSAWTGVGFQVAEDQVYQLDFYGQLGGTKLYSCDLPHQSWLFTAPAAPVAGDAIGEHSLTYGRLPAGHYALLTHNEDLSRPAEISLTITAAPGTPLSCADAPAPVMVPDDVDSLNLMADTDSDAGLSFQLGKPRNAREPFTKATLCNAECAECVGAPLVEPLPLEAGVVYFLRQPANAYRRARGVKLSPN